MSCSASGWTVTCTGTTITDIIPYTANINNTGSSLVTLAVAGATTPLTGSIDTYRCFPYINCTTFPKISTSAVSGTLVLISNSWSDMVRDKQTFSFSFTITDHTLGSTGTLTLDTTVTGFGDQNFSYTWIVKRP